MKWFTYQLSEQFSHVDSRLSHSLTTLL